jgi:hypothetical protein
MLHVRGRRHLSVCGLCAACLWLAPMTVVAEEETQPDAEPVAPMPAAPEPEPAEPGTVTAEPEPAATEAEPAAPEPAPAADEAGTVPAAPEPAAPVAPATTAPPVTDIAAPTPEPPTPLTVPALVRHGIGLRLGARGTTVREDLLVPLTFSGGGPDIGAAYRGLIGPGLLDTRFEATMALVSNRFGHPGVTLHHSLSAAYRLPLPSAGLWRFSLGGVVGESSDSLALESWDDAHGYWVGLGFVGPSASVQRQLSEGWQLYGTAELALIGTVGRPPELRHNKQDANARASFYLFHPFADSSFFTPWNVQLVRFDFAARRTSSDDRVGRGWSFGCQGRFTRASEPRTVLVFEAVLYAAWTWGL